jgi:hypothetical protein
MYDMRVWVGNKAVVLKRGDGGVEAEEEVAQVRVPGVG